ncbi:MAG: aminotransferase class V-fold PLP-dependent enzyme, partial [Candidatus Zixiibacteriota bacterium]
YKFMSGTPPIPCLYTAQAGLEIIKKVGINPIREKSKRLTQLIINEAEKRGFTIFSPENSGQRGGAVAVSLPHAHQVKQSLETRRIKVDFRKGKKGEPDIIRLGPHFYTREEEIQLTFDAIDEILDSGEYLNFSPEITQVT